MNLFINYYNAGARQKEIDYCLNKNLNHPLIKNVVIYNQHEEVKGAINIPTEKRPTYQDFFNLTREYPNDVNIIANSDIFFDETLEKAENITVSQCYAITRWEFDGEKSVPFEEKHNNNSCPAMFSQDVWMFRGGCRLDDCENVIAQRSNERVYDTIKFTIGLPGCDNVISAMLKSRYKVFNPAYQIKCHHYHTINQHKGYSHRITGGRSSWGMIRQGRIPITRI